MAVNSPFFIKLMSHRLFLQTQKIHHTQNLSQENEAFFTFIFCSCLNLKRHINHENLIYIIYLYYMYNSQCRLEERDKI